MTQTEMNAIRLKELEDVKTVLLTPRGRRFIWRLLTEAQMFSSTFTGDALSTAYNEGRREFGLRFFRDVQLFPELNLKMMQENQEVINEEKENNDGE